MPTIRLLGPYRIYFYSHDIANEPPHIHVDREDHSAKFWLDPVALARNLGYSPKELRTIERIISERREEFLEVWNEYFRRQAR